MGAAMDDGHGRRSDPSPPSPPRTSPPHATTASKRRARTISSLTQEQVRKKRENDREAQRAFRQRTKMRIHVLEDEVVELKAEHRELERSRKTELQALIEDNRALRSQIQRLTQLARPLVSLLASETENAGDGVDHVQPPPAAHRLPGNESAAHATTGGLSNATNAWPSPSTQSNMQSTAKEIEDTRPHPSPEGSSQYNAIIAQTSDFVRGNQQERWSQVRDNGHEGHDMGNISQDVDMGVEPRAATHPCTYPESLPQSAGLSPSGHDDLVQADRPLSLSSTTRPPREDMRYGGMTANGSHDPHITCYNAFNRGQPVSDPSAECTPGNTSVIRASSPQQSIAPAHRDAESGNYTL